jgi:NitT/TauT family transport system substrate-binding protein
LLKFGTVAWEIDTIAHHRLDEKHGIHLVPVEYSTNDAAKIALQAGAVDLIVTDWPWVARQRSEGAGFSFTPYSKAVGALVVSPESGIRDLADLKGKRIGVVGGPLDKSWLLLRALSKRELGIDLADSAESVFGAPPLLSEEFSRGRVDAVLTYWHYAARLEAAGATPILTVADIIGRLGAGADVPMLGYAFSESWGSANRNALKGFLQSSRDAKNILAISDDEWQRLTPLLGTSEPKVRAALKSGYRTGILGHWGEQERHHAAELYAVLVELGGERLVGRAKVLEPGTFWPSQGE